MGRKPEETNGWNKRRREALRRRIRRSPKKLKREKKEEEEREEAEAGREVSRVEMDRIDEWMQEVLDLMPKVGPCGETDIDRLLSDAKVGAVIRTKL